MMNTTYLMNPHTGTVQTAEDWEADGFTIESADLIKVMKGENGDWVVTGVLEQPGQAAGSGDVGLGQYGMTSFGMSLRDYFAAKAMQGLLSVPGEYSADADTSAPMATWDDFAAGAYKLADAMLKAREGEQ